MRGRRHKLQVSTFPFLAVLLCAMGSLILVLLVMDRKAHQAALNRARREAAQRAEQSAQSEAARQDELEAKKQQARKAWEQKRDALHARLSDEQIELQLQMRKVRDQLSQIAARLRYEQDTSTELRRKVQNERGKLQAGQQLLASLRSSAGQTEAQARASNKSLERMTVDLLQMEQALKDLKASKEREQHTFSVVPYHGRRGENRRPIYVECTADGVIFHPERRAMSVTSRQYIVGRDRPDDVPDDVRSEVERRITRQRAQLGGGTPYLLLLVRPDGVETYCLFQAVLKDLTLDFGYEFIDADWVLDFPTDDEQPGAQPWMVASKSASAPSTPVPAATSKRPVGIAPRPEPLAVSGGSQGLRTREGGGAGQWVQGMTVNGGGAAPGGSGSGTSSGTAPAGVRYIGPGGDLVSGGGTPNLTGGANLNNAVASSGQSSSVPGQSGSPGGGGGNSHSPGFVAGSSGAVAGGHDGSGILGAGTGSIRGGSGRAGHPAAMAPASGDGDGMAGGSGGSGGYVLRGTGPSLVPGAALSGSPGASSVGTPQLGPPRALSSFPARVGVPTGDGMGSSAVGIAGTGISGSPGAGTSGSGARGNGVASGASSGSTVPGSGSYPPLMTGSPQPAGSSPTGSYAITRGNGSGAISPRDWEGGPLAPRAGDSARSANGPQSLSPGAMSTGQGGAYGGGTPGGTVAGMAGTADGARTSTGNAGPASAGRAGQGSAGSGGPTRPGDQGGPSKGQTYGGQPGPAGGAPADGGGSRSRGQDSSVFAAVDPLAPSRPRGLPPQHAEEELPPERSPQDAEFVRPSQKKRLVPTGIGGRGGGGGGDPESAAMNRFATPTAGERPVRKPAALRPAWVHGGRDWTIYVECLSDGVKLYPSERVIPLAQAAMEGAGNPLVATIRQMIERRQASRRPGEPPYHPQVCLLVRAEHVRTFLSVYPALEALPAPKTRRNLDADDDVAAIVTGANP
jgi:hypothetical protein